MVNFTFVSHQGARPEKRELVKSHVMRESQKKRREAKQEYRRGLSASLEQSSLSSVTVRTETLRQCQAAPQQALQSDRPNDSYSPILSPSSSIGSSRNSDNERTPLCRLLQPTTTDPIYPTDVQLARGPRSVPTTESSFLNVDGRSHAPSLVSTQSRILGPQFLRVSNAAADPSWMPETWLNRVDEIVSHYFLSFNGTGPESRSTLTHWFEQPTKSPLILLSYSLLYCAHRDLIGGIVGNDDHYFKARNLQFINAALEDKATALADETIMAVVSMAMYENLRGSDQVLTHERGLVQMFDMRGGIKNFMLEEGFYIGNFALLVDMMYSSCSNKYPLSLEVKGPILRDIDVGVRKAYFPHSPLRVVNTPGFNATVPIEELRTSLDVLRDAFDGFEMLCIEAFDPQTAAFEAPRFRLRRDKFWARLQAFDTTETEPSMLTTEGKVKEAMRIAGTIHYCAVVSQIQHDDELNLHFVERLQEILKRLRLDFWKTAPYLYLWVLLTGGAVCSRLPEPRAYFVSEITRVGVAIGFFDWRSFTQIINNFLWLQSFLRKRTKR